MSIDPTQAALVQSQGPPSLTRRQFVEAFMGDEGAVEEVLEVSELAVAWSEMNNWPPPYDVDDLVDDMERTHNAPSQVRPGMAAAYAQQYHGAYEQWASGDPGTGDPQPVDPSPAPGAFPSDPSDFFGGLDQPPAAPGAPGQPADDTPSMWDRIPHQPEPQPVGPAAQPGDASPFFAPTPQEPGVVRPTDLPWRYRQWAPVIAQVLTVASRILAGSDLLRRLLDRAVGQRERAYDPGAAACQRRMADQLPDWAREALEQFACDQPAFIGSDNRSKAVFLALQLARDGVYIQALSDKSGGCGC